MAHFVVANLTDAQFTKLETAGIPNVEIPATLVPRFVALVPQGMTPEEALVRLVKIAILNGEHQLFSNTEDAAYRARAAAKRTELAAELGL